MTPLAEKSIDAVNVAIRHVKNFAPNAPLERFLAQEIANAYVQAYETCGWFHAAKVWKEVIEELGNVEIKTELCLR